MADVTEVVEGWTQKLIFQLYEDGAALDGTGLTVSACDVSGSDGLTIATTSGDFGWESQGSGTVYYKPDAEDLLAVLSPYRIRFQLTDGAGDTIWWPNGASDEIVVHARYR